MLLHRIEGENNIVMSLMNEDLKAFPAPQYGSRHFADGHDRSTLFEDCDGDNVIKFFFKHKREFNKIIKGLKKISCTKYSVHNYKFHADDGNIIYEDNWQVAIEFNNNCLHKYKEELIN